MTALNKQAIDFSQPLETESGEPVKYICHDVIEYKCARVCVDIATGIVYSSPYVGLKIRNKEANPRSKLREQIESAADAYWQFDNGWISDMKCGDLSHEYLLFAKEPKNVLALLDENIQLQREKDAIEAVALALRDDMRQAREQLEVAEHTAAVDHEAACSLVEENEELKRKLEAENQRNTVLAAKIEPMDRRITELESKLAKPVLLPKTNGYWNEQEKAYEEAITLAKRQIRLAGFSVEDM
ncbi:ead/Ea22-like family protein [Salmonella enterica]|uniref:ead/Ea22-like family protein n=1 Tax=Salmonella enterica TaxID=28901 RepID=UPI003D316E5D